MEIAAVESWVDVERLLVAARTAIELARLVAGAVISAGREEDAAELVPTAMDEATEAWLELALAADDADV